MHCAMGVRESANWRNVSSQLDLRIELSIESTASGRDGGKAGASASGNRLRWRLHDGASDHRPRSFSGARNRRLTSPPTDPSMISTPRACCPCNRIETKTDIFRRSIREIQAWTFIFSLE